VALAEGATAGGKFNHGVRWHAGGMASRSRDALPVLEEWYDGAVSGQRLFDGFDRPRACGVAGCAEPLVKPYHMQSRLCATHIKCGAVLCRGEPQRWCGNCCRFHALEAFSGSQRRAPASRLQRALFRSQIPATVPCKHVSAPNNVLM
jgi:hypothetical protein